MTLGVPHREKASFMMAALAVAALGVATSARAVPTTTATPTPTPTATPTPSSGAVDLPSGWRILSNDEGEFSVAMPGLTEESVDSIAGGGGAVQSHNFQVSATWGHFQANWADLAAAPAEGGDALAVARDGMIQGIGARLFSDDEVTLGGHMGRDVRFTMQSEGRDLVGRGRIFMIGRRQFIFVAVTAAENPHEADVRRFVESIVLAKPPVVEPPKLKPRPVSSAAEPDPAGADALADARDKMDEDRRQFVYALIAVAGVLALGAVWWLLARRAAKKT